MLRATVSTAILVALSLSLAHADDNDGWVCLFDGKSMDGWKAVENADSWKLKDGALVCHGPRSHLFYVGDLAPFQDFEFKAEVKTGPGANSGIYIHTKFQEEGWPKQGYEVQVNNTHGDPKKTGGLYGVRDVFEAPAKDNEWFEMNICVKGNRIVVKVDGKQVVDYEQPEGGSPDGGFNRVLSKGTFALQAHDPNSVVCYRKICVKKQ